jgi:hypothetical protein
LGTIVILLLVKNFLVKVERSVRRCVVVMQQPVILSSKFATKFSHIFTQSPLNVTEVFRIGCLKC